MTFDGTHIHIADLLTTMFDDSASVSRWSSVYRLHLYRQRIRQSQWHDFDGTHIHIADQTDDNVRMILPPSADGQASIVRTYTVSGLGNP